MKCPKCDCPFSSAIGFRTADMPHAWKDEDGIWYKGPYSEITTYTCDGCGYSHKEEYRNGKRIDNETK